MTSFLNFFDFDINLGDHDFIPTDLDMNVQSSGYLRFVPSRNPGFWDLCSILGSIQSLRLLLEIRCLRQHVRQLTEVAR
jgi:hypothetical protein